MFVLLDVNGKQSKKKITPKVCITHLVVIVSCTGILNQYFWNGKHLRKLHAYMYHIF